MLYRLFFVFCLREKYIRITDNISWREEESLGHQWKDFQILYRCQGDLVQLHLYVYSLLSCGYVGLGWLKNIKWRKSSRKALTLINIWQPSIFPPPLPLTSYRQKFWLRPWRNMHIVTQPALGKTGILLSTRERQLQSEERASEEQIWSKITCCQCTAMTSHLFASSSLQQLQLSRKWQ